MVWQGIEAFVVVGETGSFSKAAGKLKVSTSFVSRQISQLEQRLGVRLFQRTTRKVVLTESGRFYFARCSEITRLMSEANLQLADRREHPRGLIRISAGGPFAERHAAPLCAEFLKKYPDVTIDLDFSARIVDLLADDYDLAIRFGAPKDSSLTARKLASRSMCLAAAPEYIEKYGKPNHPEDLKDHDCLLGNFDRWRFKVEGEIREFRVSGRFRSRNTANALVEAALKGVGLVHLPLYHLKPYMIDDRLIPLLEDYVVRDMANWLVYPHRKLLPLRVRLLIDYLLDGFKDWRF